MERTQVYFEPEVLTALREEAIKQKTTLAAIIRKKVKKDLKVKRIKKKNAAEVLMDLANLGKKLGVKGPKDLSQKVDEFVYR